MDHRVTRYGKELKLDGKPIAQAASDEVAEAIAACLNHAGMSRDRWPSEASRAAERLFE